MSGPGKFRKPALYRPLDNGQAAWNVDVVQALRELQELPILKGHMLADVVLSAAETKVPHALGRVPSGFWVVNPTSGDIVWHSKAPTKEALYLLCTGDTTVDIWVF
jgi:hypothetical protein